MFEILKHVSHSAAISKLDQLINFDKVERLFVNTSGHDVQPKPYYVWATFESGKTVAIFKGSLATCQTYIEERKKKFDEAKAEKPAEEPAPDQDNPS